MRKLFALIIIISVIISAAAPAVAAVSGLLAVNSSGSYYLYDYQELLDSYALKLIGKPNGLYEDFSSKSPAAFLHSNGLFLDYKDTVDSYAAMALTGRKFDFNSYATSDLSKKYELPANLYRVSVSQGQLNSHKINNYQQTSASTVSSVVDSGATAATPPVAQASSVQDVKSAGTPIIAASRVSLEQAIEWASGKNAHPRFIAIAPVYWQFGQLTGICPEVLYAQAAHETRYGHFTGQVPPTFNNWAGIKTANAAGDKPEDHQQFATPEDGVRAHFNHMAAYVGLNPIGEPHGRYFVVVRLPWSGTVTTVEELSGKWAPSANYHQRVVLFLSEMYQ